MKLVLCALALAVSLSMSVDITSSGEGTSGTNWQASDGEVVMWEQLPSGNPQGSQYFTDRYPDADAGVADDIMFSSSTTANKIRWWGDYFNNGGAPGPVVAPVEIYLYLDDGTGTSPTLPQHTSAIQSWMIPVGDYDEIADRDCWLCTYEFPEWVVFDANVKYWIEIRKAFPFDPYGQYGFEESEGGFLAPCVQGFDGLYIPWWTPQDAGAAFVLIWDDALALNSSTWGDIKTIF